MLAFSIRKFFDTTLMSWKEADSRRDSPQCMCMIGAI